MSNLKKIEFFVSEEKNQTIKQIIEKENFTKAELMRRALDDFIIKYVKTNGPIENKTKQKEN